MPLPKPQYPTYVPKSFISPEDRKLSDMALGLYAKYHPGAMQQALYQSLLEDEQFKAKRDQEKLKMLMEERDTVLKNLSRFRESGLGPLGRGGAGGGAGGRRGTGTGRGTGGFGGGDVLDFYADMGSIEQRRRTANMEQGVEAANKIRRDYEPLSGHRRFIADVTRKLDAGVGTMTSDQIAATIALEASQNLSRLLGGTAPTREQAIAASTELYTNVASRFPGMFTDASGNPTEAGKRLARLIDEQMETRGFIEGSLLSGQEPTGRLDAERRAALEGVTRGVGAGFFEKAGQKVPLDANGDGVVTEEERTFAKEQEERRKALGIAEPLTDEEQVFLSRYIDALRDDGVASPEELGADYEAGKAAYEKARRADVMPRGFGPFFDPTYLNNLQRLSGLDERIAGITDREAPGALAARRTLGLPQVPQEALNAAAQVSPLAAEALPFAMKRVAEAGGQVTPRGGAEQFAQRFINTDAGARDFNGLVQAVNKRYPNDPVARREALAYYGAHYYQQDQKGQTLQQGMIDMNIPEAVSESQQFMQEVAPAPDPAAYISQNFGSPMTPDEVPFSSRLPQPAGRPEDFFLEEIVGR
jgi:hypothetical protein